MLLRLLLMALAAAAVAEAAARTGEQGLWQDDFSAISRLDKRDASNANRTAEQQRQDEVRRRTNNILFSSSVASDATDFFDDPDWASFVAEDDNNQAGGTKNERRKRSDNNDRKRRTTNNVVQTRRNNSTIDRNTRIVKFFDDPDWASFVEEDSDQASQSESRRKRSSHVNGQHDGIQERGAQESSNSTSGSSSSSSGRATPGAAKKVLEAVGGVLESASVFLNNLAKSYLYEPLPVPSYSRDLSLICPSGGKCNSRRLEKRCASTDQRARCEEVPDPVVVNRTLAALAAAAEQEAIDAPEEIPENGNAGNRRKRSFDTEEWLNRFRYPDGYVYFDCARLDDRGALEHLACRMDGENVVYKTYDELAAMHVQNNSSSSGGRHRRCASAGDASARCTLSGGVSTLSLPGSTVDLQHSLLLNLTSGGQYGNNTEGRSKRGLPFIPEIPPGTCLAPTALGGVVCARDHEGHVERLCCRPVGIFATWFECSVYDSYAAMPKIVTNTDLASSYKFVSSPSSLDVPCTDLSPTRQPAAPGPGRVHMSRVGGSLVRRSSAYPRPEPVYNGPAYDQNPGTDFTPENVQQSGNVGSSSKVESSSSHRGSMIQSNGQMVPATIASSSSDSSSSSDMNMFDASGMSHAKHFCFPEGILQGRRQDMAIKMLNYKLDVAHDKMNRTLNKSSSNRELAFKVRQVALNYDDHTCSFRDKENEEESPLTKSNRAYDPAPFRAIALRDINQRAIVTEYVFEHETEASRQGRQFGNFNIKPKDYEEKLCFNRGMLPAEDEAALVSLINEVLSDRAFIVLSPGGSFNQFNVSAPLHKCRGSRGPDCWPSEFGPLMPRYDSWSDIDLQVTAVSMVMPEDFRDVSVQTTIGGAGPESDWSRRTSETQQQNRQQHGQQQHHQYDQAHHSSSQQGYHDLVASE